MTDVDWDELNRRLRAAEAALDRGWADDAERAARLLAQRAARLASPPAPLAAAPDALTFGLGDERYALPLAALAAALPLAGWVRVPDAPRELMGLLAWRGAFLPLFDLAALLGIAAPAAAPQAALALRRGPALAVGPLDRPVDLPPELSPPPRSDQPLVAGIAPGPLVVLDEQALGTHPLLQEVAQR